jgi:hypothetical protein
MRIWDRRDWCILPRLLRTRSSGRQPDRRSTPTAAAGDCGKLIVVSWIERAPEPTRLFLAWQAPDHLGERFRWAVGNLERAPAGDCSLRYLQPGLDFETHNQGRGFDEILRLGYEGYPAFSLKRSDIQPGYYRP